MLSTTWVLDMTSSLSVGRPGDPGSGRGKNDVAPGRRSERRGARHGLEGVDHVGLDPAGAVRVTDDLPRLVRVEAQPLALRRGRVPDPRLPVDDHLELGAV